jgi:hypothetical protein
MALPSLNAVVIANIFIIIALVDNAVERSAVALLSTSIAVAIARLLQRRTYYPINIEGPDFADVPTLDLRACRFPGIPTAE